MGSHEEHQDAGKLTQFSIDLLLKHVQAKRACKAWGQLSLVLTFEAGNLKEVKTNDETTVRANMLATYPAAQQSITRHKQ